MNCYGWKIFRDIAYLKSFVKAGKKNYLSQPAVSMRLKQLENELGVKLVDRVPRNVKITKIGEKLLPHIEELIEKCDRLKLIANEEDLTIQGDVRIATIHSIGLYELTPYLKKSIREYPDIHLHLQYRRADIIYDLIKKDKIDIGIVAYPEPTHGIRLTPLEADRMALIVPPHHPLGKKNSVLLSQIHGERFVAFENGIPTGEAIKRLLEQHNVRVKIRMVNENIDTLKKAVEVGLGISIVPKKTVEEEVRKGTLKTLTIKNVKMERPIGLLTSENRPLKPAAQIFMELLCRRGRQPVTGSQDSSRLIQSSRSF